MNCGLSCQPGLEAFRHAPMPTTGYNELWIYFPLVSPHKDTGSRSHHTWSAEKFLDSSRLPFH